MGNTTTYGGGDDDLPEDVLIQILVWLPIISLLRFKSVCKSWRALIETPSFIDLHTTTLNSSSSSKFGSFIFYVERNKMFMLSSRNQDDDDDIVNDDQVDYLGFPPCSNDSLVFSLYAIRMVGSCNGIICIHEKKKICIYEKRREVVSLWNPATRQFRLLPKPITTTEPKEGYFEFVAFGFDVKTKDYKVVQFRCFKAPSPPERWFSRIQVYSLSTDSWRLLEGIHDLPGAPCYRTFQNQGIYINGCYFFVGKDESQVWLDGGGGKAPVVCNNNIIYSFDFTKEILTTIQGPDHDSRHDFLLTYLGDKMALFMVQRNLLIGGGSEFHDCGLDYEFYDIWVLNEQPGSDCARVVNKKSWTKLHSFRKINKLKHPTQPRCISNNGQFALISTRRIPCGSRELQLFNLVTGEATKNFPFGQGVIRADVYKPSLVSIIGGNGAAAAADS